MTPNQIQTRTATVSVDADHITRFTFLSGAEETLADAQEAFRVIRQLQPDRLAPLLVDIRKMKAQDRDARQFYGSPAAAEVTNCVALLVESRVSMLLANFFIAVTNPSVPVKMFTDEQTALEWLKGHAP